MSRGVFVLRDGQLIERHLAPPLHRKFADGPMVISDCMDSTFNHADGRRYDSKRAYEKAVRHAGCQIVGNDPQISRPIRPNSNTYSPDPDVERDVAHAFAVAESRAPKAKRKRRKA